MGQTTILIMILTIVSKIFGFLRESAMAAFIGAGELKSIYTTATTIPNMILWIVSPGILSAFIPIYNRVKNENDEKSANIFTSNLINILMVYGVIALIVVMIFAKQLCLIFSPDLTGEDLRLATNFTRIMMISIFALLYSSVIKPYLNIKNNFVDPAITGFILNFFVIGATILTGLYKNPYILIMGALLANIFQFVRFPFASRKEGFKYKRIINFKDPYIKQFMVLIIPIIFSSAADQLSVLVDNSMASAFFGIASVSKIFYAKTMLNFIMGVVTMTVATVSFPEIARLGQAGEIGKMKSSTTSAITLAMVLVIPATFGMMALASPIIELAFERNAFTAADTTIVSSLLVAYAPYIIFTSLIKIVGNAFYSVGDSKTPVIVVLIQQVINIGLNLILVNFTGLDGLAYATSISTAIGSGLLIFLFYKKFGSFDIRTTLVSNGKILIGSLIMVLVAKASYGFLINRLALILSLGVAIALASIVYLLIILFAKIGEVDSMVDFLRKKIGI